MYSQILRTSNFFCRFYLECVYFLTFSLALSLSHACILCFPLAHLCDYRDNNRDQNYPFFASGAKDASPYDVLVICLYIYKRTRQLGEEQQVVVVECGRSSDGAVS